MLLNMEKNWNKGGHPREEILTWRHTRVLATHGRHRMEGAVQPPSVDILKTNLSIQLIYAQDFLYLDVTVRHVFLVI